VLEDELGLEVEPVLEDGLLRRMSCAGGIQPCLLCLAVSASVP
jgi:hypothetical protein